MNIGERLKKRRESLGLTLEQVGNYIGVGRATVQRYENNSIDIKRTVAIKLAEILKTTPGYIMGWDDEIKLEPISHTPDFTPLEEEIIEAYRAAPAVLQKAVLDILHIADPDGIEKNEKRHA